MNSSQLHLSSMEKGQLDFYGVNYPGLMQAGASQPHQQFSVPPSTPPSNDPAVSQQGFQFYPVQQQKGNNNQRATNAQANQPPSVAPNNPTEHQNPSLLLQHLQSPFALAPLALPQRRRPWWMWCIGVIDIIAALLFTVKVVQQVVTKDRYIADRDALMWAFFLIFLSLCVQFLMGVGLLVGLKSEQDGTTFWYCQSWICGAYFLFCETGFLLLGALLKLHNGGHEVVIKLLIVLAKTVFRLVSFILVRRFMNDLRGKSHYRLSATEIEQYQQQRLQQLQQLQQYHQEGQQRLQQQQQQQYLQQQQEGMEGGMGAGGRRGTRGSECYYYAPQMSVMMSMMMNNAASAAIPT